MTSLEGSKSLERMPKRRRAPELLSQKRLTDRSFAIIEIISRYRFIGSKDLIRLAGGNEDVTHRHLQQLYHRNLISRMTLGRNGNNAEFIYFLDNGAGLRELCARSGLPEAKFDWSQIKTNRDKYSEEKTPGGIDSEGKLLFVRHELMISQLHAGVELACKASGGKVELARWVQGTELHSTVTLSPSRELPHRPDAFLSLRFPNFPEGQQRSNFLYEADRNTSSIPRLREKFEAHLHYLLQGKHTLNLDIKRIRAVLVETITDERARQLKRLAAELAEKFPLASLLFWIASTEGKERDTNAFPPLWCCAGDERMRSLLD